MWKKRQRSKFLQGIFRPLNESKFIGKTKPIYRSSLELSFMRWCDHNSNVLEWGSESVVIPYKNPLTNRISRYFVDFWLTLQTNEGNKRFLVEIKPYNQTMPPQTNKKGSMKAHTRRLHEYAKNVAKWEAAKSWARQKGFVFVVLTEKDLNSHK